MSSLLIVAIVIGIVVILVLILGTALLLSIPILLFRKLFGSQERRGQDTGSTGQRVRGRQWGFPTSFYVGDSKLGSLKVDQKLYDFRTPKFTPNLDKLRNPASVDLDAARKLFLGKGLVDCPHELPKLLLDMDKAKDLFIPRQGNLLDFVYPEDDRDGSEE